MARCNASSPSSSPPGLQRQPQLSSLNDDQYPEISSTVGRVINNQQLRQSYGYDQLREADCLNPIVPIAPIAPTVPTVPIQCPEITQSINRRKMNKSKITQKIRVVILPQSPPPGMD